MSLYLNLDHLHTPKVVRHADYPVIIDHLTIPVRQLLLRWGFKVSRVPEGYQVNTPIFETIAGLKWEQWQRSNFGWKSPEEFTPSSWEEEWLLPHPIYGKGKAMGCDRVPFDLLLIGQADEGFGLHFDSVYPISRPSLLREDSFSRIVRYFHIPLSRYHDNGFHLDFLGVSEEMALLKWHFRFDYDSCHPPVYPHTGLGEYEWSEYSGRLKYDQFTQVSGLPNPVKSARFFSSGFAPFVVAHVEEKGGFTVRLIERPTALAGETLGTTIRSLNHIANDLHHVLTETEGQKLAWTMALKAKTIEEFLEMVLASELPVMAKYQIKIWLEEDNVHPHPIILKQWTSGSLKSYKRGSLDRQGKFVAEGPCFFNELGYKELRGVWDLEDAIQQTPPETVMKVYESGVEVNKISGTTLTDYFIVPPDYPHAIGLPFKDNKDGETPDEFSRAFVPHWMFFSTDEDADYDPKEYRR